MRELAIKKASEKMCDSFASPGHDSAIGKNKGPGETKGTEKRSGEKATRSGSREERAREQRKQIYTPSLNLVSGGTGGGGWKTGPLFSLAGPFVAKASCAFDAAVYEFVSL